MHFKLKDIVTDPETLGCIRQYLAAICVIGDNRNNLQFLYLPRSIVSNRKFVLRNMFCRFAAFSGMLKPPVMEANSLEKRIPASISGVACGSAYVWMTPLMPRLVGSELSLSGEQLSWAVSMVAVGDLFTPVPAALLSDLLGRKTLLLAAAPAYLASWLLLLFTRSIAGLYIARLIQGMAIGITYSVLPIYLGEIASPKYRGSLGILDIYSWYLGVFFEYSIGPFLSYNAVMWASLAVTVVFSGLFVWMPETPNFLASRGRLEEAEGALRWLRGGADGAAEMEEVLQEVKLAREGASLRCGVWTELMGTRKGLSSLGLAAAVLLSCLMGGLSTLLSYTSLVFSPGQEVLCSIVLGVLLLLTVPLFGRLFDCWGRRPVYLLSSAICCVCALIIGMYYWFRPTWLPIWVADVLVIVYLVFIAGGVEGLCPIFQSELFSGSTRALGSSLVILLLTALSLVSFQLFYVLNTFVGFYTNFLVFALFCAFGFVVIYAYLPETKGKTFEEIQKCL